jgi:hypothetical protein
MRSLNILQFLSGEHETKLTAELRQNYAKRVEDHVDSAVKMKKAVWLRPEAIAQIEFLE